MAHLTMLRTMREERRGERMIKALGIFMEGKSSIDEWSVPTPPEKQSPVSKPSVELDPVASIHLANSQKKLDIPPSHIPHTELGIPLRGRQNSYRLRSPPRRARDGSLTSDETYSVLNRASFLIREALDVGGVAYLDISSFNQERHGIKSDEPSNSRSRSRDTEQDQASTGYVLGRPVTDGEGQDIAIPTPLLKALVQRYGRGGIFHLDNDRFSPSSDEDLWGTDTSSSVEDIASNHFGIDMRQLSHTFSGANTVAFFPLWDFQQTRWFAGCFAWTKDIGRAFADDKDLTYLAAFNNSVMAEVSRLDLRAADREKADFISSVSHEWRSPLHGILTMLDILKDTDVTNVQRSLIDITTNCGKTLLDTVNHVLDYAKINSLMGSTTMDDQPPEQPGAPQGSHFDAPALISQENIATLAEDVAEALLASQDYAGANEEALFSAVEQSGDRPFSEADIPYTAPRAITAIVDIEWSDSWDCCVSAGAWRRIVMNLLGNALKFTPSGFVQLKLRQDRLKAGHDDLPAILIQISDSGRGISPEFSFTNLYTPFQQEDSLSPGVGVGLNIVYRIVDSMRGLINLRSEPDHGTEVSVLLPITPAYGPSPLSLPYADLREKLRGKTISLFPESFKHGDLNIDPEIFGAMLDSMEEMITKWFGVRVLTPNEREHEHPDIFIITEHEYRYDGADKSTDLYVRRSRARKHPATSFPVIVLCTHAHSWFNKPRDPEEPVIFLQQPIAPKTLASALRSCLEQSIHSHDVQHEEAQDLSTNAGEEVGKTKEVPSTPPNDTKRGQIKSDEGKLDEYEKEEGPKDNPNNCVPDCKPLEQQCKILLVEDNKLNLKVRKKTTHLTFIVDPVIRSLKPL
jgi:signal transduction histidine kinase